MIIKNHHNAENSEMFKSFSVVIIALTDGFFTV